MAFDLAKHIDATADTLAGLVRETAVDALRGAPFSAPEVSPIEAMLGCALYLHLIDAAATARGVNVHFHRGSHLSIDEIKEHAHTGCCIAHQVKIGPYVADFVITITHFKGQKLFAVAECDGHDFHERTKEQAAKDKARDRYMQSLDLPVFRFTGSEIYADPYGVAKSLLNSCVGLMDSRAKAAA